MKLLKLGLLTALCTTSFELYAAASCEYSIENQWSTGFVGKITMTNTGNTQINNWDVNWQYTDGSVFTSGWNAQFSGTGPISASNLNWNSQIDPGQSAEFGFQGNKGVPNASAPIVQVNGDICGGDIQNLPPIAAFSSSSNQLSASFDASASSDPENAAISYAWNFGDSTTGTGISPSHTYTIANIYEVTLTVSDGVNQTELKKMVTVSQGTMNQAPIANISVSSAGLSTQFNGSNSSDPDGDALTYLWDFGDGSNSTDVSPSHTYANPSSYVVTLTVSDNLLSDSALTTVTVGEIAPPGSHATNPFLGATSYVNPDYANLIDTSIALESNPALIAKMQVVKSIPTAVWLDRIDAIQGGTVNSGRLSLEQHLLGALAQKQADTPMLISIVIYNLPDRDCSALASNGTLDADQSGLETYKRNYIDAIANIISDARFNDLRIIATIEPDSLPNLVTNQGVPKCAKVANDGTYVNGIQYALSRFSQMPNVYTYLDIAHSGWLGWDDNLQGAVQLYTDLVQGVNNGDMTVVDGFISNVSNYTPIEELFLPDPDFDFDGDFQGVRSSSYFQFNPVFDEKDFAEALHSKFVANGFPQDIAILIDTSRNGWGGPNRPSSANQNAATEDQYVNDSRLDRRNHRGNWCNVSGTGIGARPQTLPFGNTSPIEAYIWIKPPGESDGTSDSTQTTPDNEGKSFDPNCSPTFTTPGGVLTGALPNAPAAGAWFSEQFKALVESANPAL